MKKSALYSAKQECYNKPYIEDTGPKCEQLAGV